MNEITRQNVEAMEARQETRRTDLIRAAIMAGWLALRHVPDTPPESLPEPPKKTWTVFDGEKPEGEDVPEIEEVRYTKADAIRGLELAAQYCDAVDAGAGSRVTKPISDEIKELRTGVSTQVSVTVGNALFAITDIHSAPLALRSGAAAAAMQAAATEGHHRKEPARQMEAEAHNAVIAELVMRGKVVDIRR